MSRLWGQEERPGWFASIVRALAVSAVIGVGIGMYLNAEVWTPLQRYYWTEYLNTELYRATRGEYWILDEYSTSKYAIVMRDVSMVYAIRQETPTGGAERRRTRKTAGPSAIPNRRETAYGSGGDFTRCGSGIQRWSHRALPGSEPQHRRAVRAEVSAFWPAGCLGRVA